MVQESIDLQYEPDLVQLKSSRGRRWYFLFFGGMLVLYLFIIYTIYSQDHDREASELVGLCFQTTVPVIFIIRGIYAIRKDRQLFVAFGPDTIRFRNAPGESVTKIGLEQLRSVEQHTLGAYLHLRNGKKVYLNWELADYDHIQQIKHQLKSIQELIKKRAFLAKTDVL